MTNFFVSPLAEQRLVAWLGYASSLVQFSLYGVDYGRKLRARGITILNHGHIRLGDNVSLTSHPEGTSYSCSLRTYFAEAEIVIGNDCKINGAVLHSNRSIRIGNGVLIGPGAILVDNDSHPPVIGPRRYSDRPPDAPIKLCDCVWIGMRSLVMKGVTVGEHTIVAAGSIVTRSLPAGVIAAGAPAKPIKDLKT